jgi:uncharacterized protein YdeI (YjbR/CyaY-like superfamily)
MCDVIGLRVSPTTRAAGDLRVLELKKVVLCYRFRDRVLLFMHSMQKKC